ncbi:uncharacterized protein AB675_9482 [Cyphellophora attinorum]|uniref:RING-type E3 ubiquitin transferase n=1 Tax=Cyphellophora attinorum TaxID=1664694 RepID=A0A0N1HCY5_9EURO|nr:uncharacterized protein AB675_9482 [Phialophora attinorum]KPI42353.1 hypothetical protein AB675_9482 [Phialophora attinorum]
MSPPTRCQSLTAALTWLALSASAVAQQISPSNNSADLFPASDAPRYTLNSTLWANVSVELAALGPYNAVSHRSFVSTDVNGHLIPINAANANSDFKSQLPNFFYISCDPEDYNGGNIPADEVFRIAINNNEAYLIVLYSRTSNHCLATNLEQLPEIFSVMTTTSSRVADQLASLDLTSPLDGPTATLLPDMSSFSNQTGNQPWSGGNTSTAWTNRSPTTAVAMIILYSITGVITALFITIIVTGAIRAHRHPERYGPRNVMGRGRQSRAKGIARAMLDTIPIVKFGDRNDGSGGAGAAAVQKAPSVSGTSHGDANRDIEMTGGMTRESGTDGDSPVAGKEVTAKGAAADTTTTEIVPTPIDEEPKTLAATPPQTNSSSAAPATGATTSEAATTSPSASTTDTTSPNTEPPPTTTNTAATTSPTTCSSCTDDFELGADVRVLPCNHHFHPECVDPWLLNVSGTCPLCRIDLRPPTSDDPDLNEEALGGSDDARRSGSIQNPEAALFRVRPAGRYHGLGGLGGIGQPGMVVYDARPPVTAGFRAGEDFIMASSLRSGRSRGTRRRSSAAGVPAESNQGNGAPASGTATSTGAFASLRQALASSNQQERIAALRDFAAVSRREARQGAASSSSNTTAGGNSSASTVAIRAEEHQLSIAQRLRERLRVRTERRGSSSLASTIIGGPNFRQPGGRGAEYTVDDEGPTLGQIRSREHVGGRPL